MNSAKALKSVLITLGVLAAAGRKFVSPIARKLLSEFKKKETKQKEEVKFPEK